MKKKRVKYITEEECSMLKGDSIKYFDFSPVVAICTQAGFWFAAGRYDPIFSTGEIEYVRTVSTGAHTRIYRYEVDSNNRLSDEIKPKDYHHPSSLPEHLSGDDNPFILISA